MSAPSAFTTLLFSGTFLGLSLVAPQMLAKAVYGPDTGAAAYAAGVNPFSEEGKAITAAALAAKK